MAAGGSSGSGVFGDVKTARLKALCLRAAGISISAERYRRSMENRFHCSADHHRREYKSQRISGNSILTFDQRLQLSKAFGVERTLSLAMTPFVLVGLGLALLFQMYAAAQ